jgi:hypothetical protein
MKMMFAEAEIDPRDERVDVSAKFSLQRMSQRSDIARMHCA